MGRVSGLEDHRHERNKTPMTNFTHGIVRGDKDHSRKKERDANDIFSLKPLQKQINEKV